MRKEAVEGASITSWQMQQCTCPIVSEVLTKLCGGERGREKSHCCSYVMRSFMLESLCVHVYVRVCVRDERGALRGAFQHC